MTVHAVHQVGVECDLRSYPLPQDTATKHRTELSSLVGYPYT